MKTIILLTGYDQRYYKISSTHLSNTGITTRSALRLRSLTYQAQTPRHGFTIPAAPAEDYQIIVDQAVIDPLRVQIPVSREDSMRWVDDSFEVAARNTYNAVGRIIFYRVGRSPVDGTNN